MERKVCFKSCLLSINLNSMTLSRIVRLCSCAFDTKRPTFFFFFHRSSLSLDRLIESQQNTSGFLDKLLALLRRPICSLCYSEWNFCRCFDLRRLAQSSQRRFAYLLAGKNKKKPLIALPLKWNLELSLAATFTPCLKAFPNRDALSCVPIQKWGKKNAKIF